MIIDAGAMLYVFILQTVHNFSFSSIVYFSFFFQCFYRYIPYEIIYMFCLAHICTAINVTSIQTKRGLSWPWSYGSWIYNYLCNQCLSPVICEYESRWGRGVQHYMIKFVSDLRQVGDFLQILRFPPPIKLTATI
jgi:hypothetical protein